MTFLYILGKFSQFIPSSMSFVSVTSLDTASPIDIPLSVASSQSHCEMSETNPRSRKSVSDLCFRSFSLFSSIMRRCSAAIFAASSSRSLRERNMSASMRVLVILLPSLSLDTSFIF